MRPDELLLQRIKARLPELEEVHIEVTSHWEEEDAVYRYYHGSFKVYAIQDCTKRIVAMLQELGDGLELNRDFLDIIEAGTDIKFEHAHNAEWDKYTLPQLQAFWHAKYMLEKMIKYGKELESAPDMLPSGWASVLYLYNLR